MDSPAWRFGAGFALEYIRADSKLGIKAGNNSINSLNTISVGLSSNQHQVAKGAALSPSLEFGRIIFGYSRRKNETGFFEIFGIAAYDDAQDIF